ncbi:MAG: hypothetical protein RSD01_02025 [Ruthenibacterium sp.]
MAAACNALLNKIFVSGLSENKSSYRYCSFEVLGYQQLWEQYPERVKRLDATQSPEQVFAQALQYLN